VPHIAYSRQDLFKAFKAGRIEVLLMDKNGCLILHRRGSTFYTWEYHFYKRHDSKDYWRLTWLYISPERLEMEADPETIRLLDAEEKPLATLSRTGGWGKAPPSHRPPASEVPDETPDPAEQTATPPWRRSPVASP